MAILERCNKVVSRCFPTTQKYVYLHHLDASINAVGILVFWVFSENIFRIYMCFIKSTHLEKYVGTLRLSLENKRK